MPKKVIHILCTMPKSVRIFSLFLVSEHVDLLSPLSGLQKSLQTCRVSENKEKLMGLINAYTRQKAKLKVQI